MASQRRTEDVRPVVDVRSPTTASCRQPGIGAGSEGPSAASLGNFEHSLLQLEVAALARRGGWRATFEPKPDRAGTRVTDLRLTRSGASMLVEVKGSQLDDVVRADFRLADIVSQSYLALQLEHDVYVSGDISSSTSRDELDGWLATLGPLAAMVAQDQQRRQSQPPFGGLVEIRAGLPAHGTHHSMPIGRRDGWARITAQIDAKDEQGRGAEPLWLRFEETGQFWSLAAPPDQRLEWAESWAAALEQRLSIHEHVGSTTRWPGPGHLPEPPAAGLSVGAEQRRRAELHDELPVLA